MNQPKYEVNEILTGFRQLISENEVACVLIGASMIDKSLENLLINYFRKGKTSARMLSDQGIFGSLRAKADCSYVLELIDKQAYSNIMWILEIRNYFGHHYAKCSFSDERIVSICEKHNFKLIDPSNEDLFYSTFNRIGIIPTEEGSLLRKYRCITFETVKTIRNKMNDDSNKQNTKT